MYNRYEINKRACKWRFEVKFEKKLIILNGEYNGKGTLNLEHNAYGIFVTLNLHNLPDLKSGEYCVGIKNSMVAYTRQLGALGRILLRFQIDLLSLDEIHCVIFDTVSLTPVMYGTNAKEKLWSGNMMDGFSGKFKSGAMPVMQALSKKPITYSSRKQDINQYIFDISSKAGEQSALSQSVGHERDNSFDAQKSASPILQGMTYDDAAIAQVNYFEKKDMVSETAAVNFNKATQIEEIEPLLIENCDDNEVLPPCKQECEELKEVVLEHISDKNEQNKRKPDNLSIVDDATSYFEGKSTSREKESRHENSQASIMAMASSAQKSIDESLIKMEKMERQFFTHASDENNKNELSSLLDEKTNKVFNQKPSNAPSKVLDKEVDKVLNKNVFKGSYGSEGIESKKKLKSLKIKSAAIQDPKIMAHGEAAFTVPPVQSYTAANLNKSVPTKIFYEQIAEQLEQLFASSKRSTDLEELMPETKWARIEFDEKGKYYVVGVIGSPVEYICYGVPALYTPNPPPQLGGGSRWLPISAEKPQDKGYWLMFQDAISGETID